MKDVLVPLFWQILGLSILPVAKLVAKGAIAVVKKSPRDEDDKFLKALADEISKELS